MIFTGNFEAALTSHGACAWLGPGRSANLWPAGYRVRFHPTQLIDAQGKVRAKAGQYVGFRGHEGPRTASMSDRCGDLGKMVLMLEEPG